MLLKTSSLGTIHSPCRIISVRKLNTSQIQDGVGKPFWLVGSNHERPLELAHVLFPTSFCTRKWKYDTIEECW